MFEAIRISVVTNINVRPLLCDSPEDTCILSVHSGCRFVTEKQATNVGELCSLKHLQIHVAEKIT